MSDSPKITVMKNGPYLVTGNIPLEKEIAVTEVIFPVRWVKGEKIPVKGQYTLCRCGRSSKMPFCDGSHVKVPFDGTETAKNVSFELRAEKVTGPGVDLADVVELCSGARFCDVGGGTWVLTEKSDDPAAKQKAIQQTFDCPSGRLVAIDKDTGKPIEPLFEKSISATEDQVSGISGPLWVKGGIPVESSDGSAYEIRNRVTLCRCGQSANKPFCDGKHMEKNEHRK
jgi:CDGSH-type Zn-finger protein